LLQLHPLVAKIDGLHSASINMVFRITLVMIITEKEIILINVGCHDEV
jgi:mRNA-degrading endonuclease YafQ of YafQ-DinJ toxin-antitoxin module